MNAVIVVPVNREAECIVQDGKRYCEKDVIGPQGLGMLLLFFLVIGVWLWKIAELLIEEPRKAAWLFFGPVIFVIVLLLLSGPARAQEVSSIELVPPGCYVAYASQEQCWRLESDLAYWSQYSRWENWSYYGFTVGELMNRIKRDDRKIRRLKREVRRLLLERGEYHEKAR